MPAHLALFTGFGVELEYMIVDGATLSVRPIADELLQTAAGEIATEVPRGAICWSNELALHLIELKSNGPVCALATLPPLFAAEVRHINRLLAPRGARLMPSAMHPWMNAHTESRLWPHEQNDIYQVFDRIFDCGG